MKKIICDRCGKEYDYDGICVSGKIGALDFFDIYVGIENGHIFYGDDDSKLDLCDECKKKLMEWMNN